MSADDEFRGLLRAAEDSLRAQSKSGIVTRCQPKSLEDTTAWTSPYALCVTVDTYRRWHDTAGTEKPSG